jgi:hypothetical protein
MNERETILYTGSFGIEWCSDSTLYIAARKVSRSASNILAHASSCDRRQAKDRVLPRRKAAVARAWAASGESLAGDILIEMSILSSSFASAIFLFLALFV